MAISIQNNNGTAVSLGELNRNITEFNTSLRKLSSGRKIAGAYDGASEFAIGAKMRTMIRSLGQDIENSQKGIDLVKVAEGGIQSIVDELRCLKEMALNSANDHNTDEDRATIQKEFASRMSEISDITATTNYNGIILLDGRWGWREYVEYKNSPCCCQINPTCDCQTQNAPINNLSAALLPTGLNVNNDDTIDQINLSNAYGMETPNFLLGANNSATNLQFDTSVPAKANTITGLIPTATGKYLGTASNATPYGGVTGYMPEYYRYIHKSGNNLDIYNLSNTVPGSAANLVAYKSIPPVGTEVSTHYSKNIDNSAYGWYHGTIIEEPGSKAGYSFVPPTYVVEQTYDKISPYSAMSTSTLYINQNVDDRVYCAVELNFKNATINGNAPAYPDSFHGQGISILHPVDGSLVSIIFDATQDAGTGTLLTDIPQHATVVTPGMDLAAMEKTRLQSAFVIGIKGATDANAMGQALFDGVKDATSNWPSWVYGSLNSDTHVQLMGEHPLRLVKNGNAYTLRMEGRYTSSMAPADGYPTRFIVYNGVLGISGTLGDLPDSGGDDTVPSGDDTSPGGGDTTPGGDTVPGSDDTVPSGDDTVPGGDDTMPGGDTTPGGDTVPSGDDTIPGGDIIPDCCCPTVEKISRFEGNPLVIHTGPRANQNLHVYINCMYPEAMGLQGVAVNTSAKATNAIDRIDAAIEYALNECTQMGAYQNRLSQTIDTLTSRHENVTAAESVISDADMAKEMADYMRHNILTQASQAMLAQANQNAAGVLSLLQ